MNLLNVKSTMINGLLDVCLPHYCCYCGQIGSILCESCKYDIVSEQFGGCLLCGRLTSVRTGRCSCNPVIDRSWCGGERRDGLEELINRFKFEYAQAAYVPLGDIILSALPELPSETVVVPVPTIRTHVRQRGYDHTALLARYVADERRVTFAQPLKRKTATVQRGKGRKERFAQAKQAFEVHEALQGDVPYLLIDDVVTTGATLQYAAKALKDAGAGLVWAVAAARQTLD